ncbi:ABC transporter permease [Streptomyces sp. NPDC050617]|uniref:ABC transporter permease n=1 Tax=Streptomyces sp. NPDC050617 TaxID=3154628 RepID=UPI0034235D40
MSGTTAEAPVRAEDHAPSATAGAATRALTRAEAVRLLRHPAVLAAFALYLAQWAYGAYSGDDRYPVLHDEDRYTQVPLLLIAAGTLLAANLAALRSYRHGADAMFDLLVLPPWRRTWALLLALLPVTALSAVLAGARIGYVAAQDAAIGGPSMAELATGPLVVLLTGAIGVFAARVVRSVAAAPLTLAALGIVTVAGALQPKSNARWWGLVGIEDENVPPLPTALTHRPVSWHLLYLAALLTLVAAAAVLRAGGPSTAFRATAGVALLALIGTGVAQQRGLPDDVRQARTIADNAPSSQQVCVERDAVAYCAFPEFEDRYRQWAEVTGGVLHRVPPSEREQRYTVRQHVFLSTVDSGVVPPLPVTRWAADDRAAGTPRAVPVGTDWGTHSELAGDHTLGFAGSFAYRAVTGESLADARGQAICRARGAITLWLAVQATDGTREAYESLSGRTFGGLSLTAFDAATGFSVNVREQELVRTLLTRPGADIGAKVQRSWTRLTAPDTTTDEAAALLGVPAPPAAREGEEGRCL